MTFHLVDAGEEAFLDLALAVNYTARLFTNDVTDGLTAAEIDDLAISDFTEASFPGYAGKALTGGSWTTTQDEPSTGVYAAQTYTRTSTGASQTVYGVLYATTAGGLLRWFETFDTPVVVTNNGDAIVLTPRITMGDGEDTDMVARGLVAEFVSTANSSSFTADGVSDFAISNVPAVAGRHYKVHVHSQYTISVDDGRWNLLFRANGATVDRLANIGNTTNAVGTFASEVATLDAWIDWEPSVTAATDDLDIFLDETGDGSTLSFQGAATAMRWMRVYDMGLAV